MLVSEDLHVSIVGPLAPPAGGMAGQTRQLCDLLLGEGIDAEIVRTNPPYRPRFVERLRGVRALFRFVPYLARLWTAAGRSSVLHVMANSGWAWHLFAAPAVWIGKLRRVRVIVNYRGGAAEAFLARSAACCPTDVAPGRRRRRSVGIPALRVRQIRHRGDGCSQCRRRQALRSAPAVAAKPVTGRAARRGRAQPRADLRHRDRDQGVRHPACGAARGAAQYRRQRPERAMLGSSSTEFGLVGCRTFCGAAVARRNGGSVPQRDAAAEFERRRQHAELAARGDGLRHSDREHATSVESPTWSRTGRRRCWCRRASPKRWRGRWPKCSTIRRSPPGWSTTDCRLHEAAWETYFPVDARVRPNGDREAGSSGVRSSGLSR